MITWTPVSENDTLKIETINRAYDYQQYLKTLLFQYAGRNVFLLEPDTSKSIRTIPFTDLINKIEKNLNSLFGSWKPTARKASVEWFGELLDQRLLDYTDVNRWFEMMILLEELIIAIPQRIPITGTFRTGSDRTRQIIKQRLKLTYIWNYILDGTWRLGEKPFVTIE